MSYKSLLTVSTDMASLTAQLAQASDLAHALDAHLEVLCLGVDMTQTGYAYAGINALIVQEAWTRAFEQASELESAATKALEGSDLRWSVEEGATTLAEVGRVVARRARFSDLAVLPKPYGKNVGPERESVVEAALFDGRTPVLVVPEGVALDKTPGRIVVAWNESAEALSAIRRALPFLKKADTVHITVIDPPAHGPDRSDPGGLVAQMLARHGVTCEIDVLGKSLTRVSDVLNRHVTDIEADMIVMGAYGHSRFREAILGGATRNMLEHATVPVLMAH